MKNDDFNVPGISPVMINITFSEFEFICRGIIFSIRCKPGILLNAEKTIITQNEDIQITKCLEIV